MSYSVYRKGKRVASGFSTFRQAEKFVESKTGFFSFDEWYDYEIRNDGPCYLTTAAVDFKGLADDGEELTMLRQFRDGYLKQQAGGEEEIRAYYDLAPQILDKINASDQREVYLEGIYRDLILPSLDLIRANRLEQAHQHYKDYTLKLKKDLL